MCYDFCTVKALQVIAFFEDNKKERRKKEMCALNYDLKLKLYLNVLLCHEMKY